MKKYSFYISKFSQTIFEEKGPVFIESKYSNFPFFEGTMDDLKSFAAKELLLRSGQKAYVEVETCYCIDNRNDLLERQIENLHCELDGESDDDPTDKMAWLVDPIEESEVKENETNSLS